MMLSQIGLEGQLKLKRAKVLVVGAGGLGCPVLLYLAAAGVGEITILDHDTVELSNLHRQVLHTEGRIGMGKAESARTALQQLNSDIVVHAHRLPFTPSLFHPPLSTSSTPASVMSGSFTLILDCTDNPATRHFLNAYAVAHDVPLVSGGAVRAEGTVGAYGLHLASPSTGGEPVPPQRGPCYACIFPPSPPAPGPPSYASPPVSEAERLEREREEDAYYERLSLAGTGACADEGVVGVLCGVVGIGMVGEAMKVLLGTATPSLHLFSPLSASPYRSIKTRSRKVSCTTCGTTPAPSSATALSTPASRWAAFLADPSGTWPGWQDPLCESPGVGQRGSSRMDARIKVNELREAVREGKARIVDTRPAAEFGIASIEGSVNIPFSRLLKDPSLALAPSPTDPPLPSPPDASKRITFLCRRGNDSLLASRALRRYLAERGSDGETIEVDDVIGGLTAWAREEEGFPVY
ncbi:hypothetical protein Rhopal_007078-T1 [Rhodotorula paludigena]|uniref:Rhodanese domain-containing protein n=1 Tax=Rhodotorula paludigena TaxID=86838 RepID=A0AAV5GVN9_9BASI|nr:hypothetical protein Rhopal_007078-T1 [Rhodotorula paludigena]